MFRFVFQGKRTHDQTLDKMKNPVAAFPEKIDELMMTLDKVNFDINCVLNLLFSIFFLDKQKYKSLINYLLLFAYVAFHVLFLFENRRFK